MRRDYTALIGLLDEFGIKDKIDFAFDWSVDPMRPVTAAPAPAPVPRIGHWSRSPRRRAVIEHDSAKRFQHCPL
ncbi:MAG: hypothetical protein ACJ8J7_16450 [Sulfurifustaceae bacterium]